MQRNNTKLRGGDEGQRNAVEEKCNKNGTRSKVEESSTASFAKNILGTPRRRTSASRGLTSAEGIGFLLRAAMF